MQNVYKPSNKHETFSRSTFLKFPDFHNQTNDDIYEENSQSAQDHTRQLCYSFTLYKKDH